jgi:hypothetical protein
MIRGGHCLHVDVRGRHTHTERERERQRRRAVWYHDFTILCNLNRILSTQPFTLYLVMYVLRRATRCYLMQQQQMQMREAPPVQPRSRPASI